MGRAQERFLGGFNSAPGRSTRAGPHAHRRLRLRSARGPHRAASGAPARLRAPAGGRRRTAACGPRVCATCPTCCAPGDAAGVQRHARDPRAARPACAIRGEHAVRGRGHPAPALGARRWTAFMRPGKRLARRRRDPLRRGATRLSWARSTPRSPPSATAARSSSPSTWRARTWTRPSRRAASCRCRPTSPPAGRRTSATAPTTRPSMPARTARSPRPPRACISRPTLLARLRGAGVGAHFVTLHVGAGTFLPVKTERRRRAPDARRVGRGRRRRRPTALNAARAARRAHRLRRHHHAAPAGERRRRRTARFAPFAGETDIFITPGYRFRAADVLMTNFHLPRSTLFMLVAAFVGLERMRAAYAHAIASGYRFYSYGDAGLFWQGARERLSPSRSPRRDGAARTGVLRHRARRHPHARLHAGRHRRHGQGADRGPGALDRRGHHPRQHLPPDAAARRGAGGAAGRAAPVHALGAADPDRLAAASR